MYSIFHYLLGFSTIAFGVGLVIMSFSIDSIGRDQLRWAVLGAGIASIGVGGAYLWG